jgi:glutathione S-transferase
VGIAPPVLWQFRYSHYNEKARWALDWKGIRHVRRSLLPGLHVPRVLWMTGQKAVPVLVVDGRTIPDSTRIIEALEEAYPEPPLYPRNETERHRALVLEDFFDEELGPHVRRALFHALLPQTGYAAALMATGCGPRTRLVYRALFPAIRAAMRLDMRIDDVGAELGRAKVRAALDRLEAELQPSGYLVADRFSVADLTAAALLSPLVMPPEFPYQPPAPMPEQAAAFRASLAGRPGFRWAAEMYRRHRGVSMDQAAPP